MKDRLFTCDFCGQMWAYPTDTWRHICKKFQDEIIVASPDEALQPIKDNSIQLRANNQYILPEES